MYLLCSVSLLPAAMAYRLQVSAGDHQATVSSFLESCREKGPDLTLLSEEGLPVTTNSLTLSLYSPSLRKILASLPPSSSLSLSVPAPSSSLMLLLKLLSEGLVMGRNRQELEQVQGVAKVLGIDMYNCQVGSRRNRVEKKKKEAEEEEKMDEDDKVDQDEHSKKEVQVEENAQVKQNDQLKEQDEKIEYTIKTEVNESQGTGDYSCIDCGKQFRHQGHFKRHKLSHTRRQGVSQEMEKLAKDGNQEEERNSDHETEWRKGGDQTQEFEEQLEWTLKKDMDESQVTKKHMLSNTKQKSKKVGLKEILTCTQCQKTFKGFDKLTKHITKKHDATKRKIKSEDNSESNQRIPCNYCDKTFSRKDKLSKHNKVKHTEHYGITKDGSVAVAVINPFPCEHCEKTFTSNTNRERHIASIHTGVTICCEECGKKYSRRDKLTVHKRKKHGN